MIKFHRTRDLELVRRALTHPTQYRMACDDSAPRRDAFQVNDDERIIYLVAAAGEDTLGVFTLLPRNAVCFEIHAALLPFSWGQRTRKALRGALAWAFKFTSARRIVCSIPQYNRLAIKLARDAGMTEYGRDPRAFLRGGELHDLVLLGISAA